jgi:nucleoside-diphosphate-sugar epimerase
MKVLITGASGFIGSNLVEKLAKEKYKIRALIRDGELNNPDGRIESLKLLKNLGVEIVEGDLLNLDSLKKAVSGIDIIFHLGAIARPMAIPKERYFEVNEKGTKNLLEACKNKKIKIIIIMSSISAVGPSIGGKPINEKTVCKPIDTYGWSKLAQEKIAEEYLRKYKMPIIFLRPSMVFGPRDFEMFKLFKAVNKRFFPIKGKEKCMEFLYVGNLIEACILAIKKGKTGEKYHIANAEHYSINEIIKSIAKAEKVTMLPITLPNFVFTLGGYAIEIIAKWFNFHPPFKHDTVIWMTKKFWYSDISKAREELGYKAKITLDEGTKKTAEYYKERGMIS